ncbi:hypothetical protein M9H77_16649 [Catharanthus roseus]|uniref:Uncharacterized protein n=1 Tax=Catharanthus roseus TaxID=4058 RepID=A0ACC0B2B8_CATRO|nr:hypothetical protein M9H77_16649 [Catharanthus roseus]
MPDRDENSIGHLSAYLSPYLECSKLCVIISLAAEPLASPPLSHCVFNDRVYGSLYVSFLGISVIIVIRFARYGISSSEWSFSSSSSSTVGYNIDGSLETIYVIAVTCSGIFMVLVSGVIGTVCGWIGMNSTST